MRWIKLLLWVLILQMKMPVTAQCLPGNFSVECEIERAGDSVVRLHANDDFYFFVRFLPSVWISTDDYVLRKENNQWTLEFFKTTYNPPPWVSAKKNKRKRIIETTKLSDSAMAAFLHSADTERLSGFNKRDSLSEGILNQRLKKLSCMIVICTKGVIQRLAYPVRKEYERKTVPRVEDICLQSNYLNDLLEEIKLAFLK